MRRARQRGVTLMELLVAVTLLSLLSVGMLFAMRAGLTAMSRTNARFTDNRRILGVERVLTQQVAGFIAAPAVCAAGAQTPAPSVPFFQGDPQVMRFVTSYSMQAAGRGYPQILEYFVIPGENGRGVRLVVNEHLYTGPLSTGSFCGGIAQDPAVGVALPLWRPPVPMPRSFVLADKLAYCRFAYREERPPNEPDLWLPRWLRHEAPVAVRIDMAPIDPEPSRLHLPAVVAPIHVTRQSLLAYTD